MRLVLAFAVQYLPALVCFPLLTYAQLLLAALVGEAGKARR